jgi:PAS domain S-box-containing protein
MSRWAPAGEKVPWLLRGEIYEVSATDGEGSSRGKMAMINSWFTRSNDKHAMKSEHLSELDCSAVPMWIFDVRTLAFLAVNDAAVQNYGYSREQFLAMTIADIRPTEDPVPPLRGKLQERKHDTNREVWRHQKRDGSVIEVGMTSREVIFNHQSAEMVTAAELL